MTCLLKCACMSRVVLYVKKSNLSFFYILFYLSFNSTVQILKLECPEMKSVIKINLRTQAVKMINIGRN